MNPSYADQAGLTFKAAGVSDRAEVRLKEALALLPTLLPEAPLDVVLNDADYIIRHGRSFQDPPPDPSSEGAAEYTRMILEHPGLESAAALSDDAKNRIDGFTVSSVK